MCITSKDKDLVAIKVIDYKRSNSVSCIDNALYGVPVFQRDGMFGIFLIDLVDYLESLPEIVKFIHFFGVVELLPDS